MPNYRPLARRMARKYGVPEGIYLSLVSHESGWNPTAGSPAGAVGLAQIHLPSHPDVTYAQATNPRFALDFGARYLAAQHKAFGTWRLALAAYNAGPGRVKSGSWTSIPETTNYVKNVLADAGQYKTGGAGGVAPGTAIPLSSDALAPPAAPDLSAPVLAGLGKAGTHEFDPVGQLGELTSLVAAGAQQAPAAVPGTPSVPSAPAAAGDWKKWVTVPPARGSTSKPHQPEILSFVGTIAQRYGRPLAVWDNTTHSRMTVNGNESAHYGGNAADIPATGAKLIRLGRLALMRAGMPRKQAMKQRGGLFNVGGYQIIFNTDVGGNHHDHVHVGIRH